MVSEEFQTHVIIKSLQQLGYQELANDLLVQYRTRIQSQQSQEIPSLLNWFLQTLRTHKYQAIDDYLLQALEGTNNDLAEFVELTNYQGQDYHSLVYAILYMIRRINFFKNRDKLDELQYISDKLLPLLESFKAAELKDLFEATILSRLEFEQESKIFLNKDISTQRYFFDLPNVDDDLNSVQDAIFQKLFILSPVVFNSVRNVPLLTTLVEQAVKYRQSQSPLYLPPRSKHDRKKVTDPLAINSFNVTKLMRTLTHHSDEVWFLKFSPSGKYLVTGSLDGRMVLYDVQESFKLIKILEPTNAADDAAFCSFSSKPTSGKTKAVIYCCWDQNEQYIVSCCLDTVVRIWAIGDIHRKRITRSEVHTAHEIRLMTCFSLGSDIKTWSCEFLPQTKEDAASSLTTPYFLIGSPDKVLKVFDCHGAEIFDFYANLEEESDRDDFNFFQMKTNSRHAHVLDLAPHQEHHLLPGPVPGAGPVPVPAHAPTPAPGPAPGPALRGGDDVSMKDADEGTSRLASNGAENNNENPFYRINDLAVTPDGRILITANNDQQLHFFSIPEVFDESSTSKKLAAINLKGRLTSCSVSSNGKYVLISSAPDELQVWDISPLYNSKPPILYRRYIGHSQSTYIIRSSFGYLNEETGEEELVLSGSDDGHVYFWKFHTGQLITRIKAHVDLCNAVDWNLKGAITKSTDYGKIWGSVGDDKLVKIWGA
ncbi:uncharacterized protein LODBEIA_P61210 [Lodderomyces beijingensis]|uniref:WD40 repeat-like protein n=1 Tax=Lodderomyces beijingensis TaxID=1775926 RepID=A0ABP0ZX81_9ASCO